MSLFGFGIRVICCSVAKPYLTLCDPIDCSTPGSPVLSYLLEFAQVPAHWIIEATQPSHLLSPLFSFYPPSLLTPGSFPMSWLFTSGGQNIGASASASVLSMNIQGWSLGLTRLILQSKRLSRVFSSIAVWKRSFCGI